MNKKHPIKAAAPEKCADSFNVATGTKTIELNFNLRPCPELEAKLRVNGFRSYPLPGQLSWYQKPSVEVEAFIEKLKSALTNHPEGPELHLEPSYEAGIKNLENKQFSYVQFFMKDNTAINYIVFEPSKPRAEVIAFAFARQLFAEKFNSLLVSPRTFIREARILFTEGKVIFSELNKGINFEPIDITEPEPLQLDKPVEDKIEKAIPEQENKQVESNNSKAEHIKVQPYSTIYSRLIQVIPGLEQHLREGIESGKSTLNTAAIMDLNYDFLGKDAKGQYSIALAHYYKQNGDMVPDPDMQIRVMPDTKMAEALSYQDIYGFQEIYSERDGKETVDLRLKKDLNGFLKTWLGNLIQQGHKIILTKEQELPDTSSIKTENLGDDPLTNEFGVFTAGTARKNFEKIIVPISKGAGFKAEISLAQTSNGDFRMGLTCMKNFGDASGSSYSPSIEGSSYSDRKSALAAALHELELDIEKKMLEPDLILNNEDNKKNRLILARRDVREFAKKNGVLLPQIKEVRTEENAGNKKQEVIKALSTAYWRKEDEAYPGNKININGTDFQSARLRELLMDKFGKLPLSTQLSVADEMARLFKERRPIEHYEKDLISPGKKGNEKKMIIIRHYIEDMIIDNDLLKRTGNKQGVLQFLIQILINTTEKLVDMPNEKTTTALPHTCTERSRSSRKSPFELNKDIEALIDKKDRENNTYTEEDRLLMQSYTGSGGLLNAGATGRGVLYEYFTPEEIVKKMWGLAFKYGFTGGAVLEPACGTGNFFKYAPARTSLFAYETNHYSKRITQILYPKAIIREMAFESIFYLGNVHLKGKPGITQRFDLIIGNPPYGEFTGKYAGMGEKQYTGATEYEQYFILRGLDVLKKEGLLIFIVPSTFLLNNDKFNKTKEKIAEKADLIDAYRLPTRLFKTTDIGTDIVVFRKLEG